MPLTRGDVEALLEQAGPAGADLRGLDLRDADLSDLDLVGVVFGSGREERDAALLEGASFRGARLRRCSFTRCQLTDVDLRNARLRDCDMRYVVTTRTTFADARITGCDFYRASLDAGTVFDPEELRGVSLTRASLQGVTALRRAHLVPGALVQEDPEAYMTFLERTLEDSPHDDLEQVVAARFGELEGVMRTLSGHWAGQGQTGDAGWAYAQSKEFERRSAAPWSGASEPRPARWLGLTVARVVCGYGLSVWRVLGTLVALALLPAIVLSRTGGVLDDSRPAHRLADTMLFSVGSITGSVPEHLSAGTTAVEWVGMGQFALGVVLLGLFGFVLGNVIRSS